MMKSGRRLDRISPIASFSDFALMNPDINDQKRRVSFLQEWKRIPKQQREQARL
jgi:hypothetical protein